jgi:hypothetical protein
MHVHVVRKSPAALSYYAMSKALGLVALSLPFVLGLGSIALSLGANRALPHPLLQRSISDYYYTPMRNYYVGSLCAIAVFLLCLRGYDVADEVAEFLAGIFAFGVAVFPPVNPRAAQYSSMQVKMGFVHAGFAALMFLTLAYLCVFRFRKTAPGVVLTRRKRHRNRVYAACGVAIVVSMVGMTSLTLARILEGRHPSQWLFWLESLAMAAFGTAWLTKGGGLWRDNGHGHGNHGAHGAELPRDGHGEREVLDRGSV